MRHRRDGRQVGRAGAQQGAGNTQGFACSVQTLDPGVVCRGRPQGQCPSPLRLGHTFLYYAPRTPRTSLVNSLVCLRYTFPEQTFSGPNTAPGKYFSLKTGPMHMTASHHLPAKLLPWSLLQRVAPPASQLPCWAPGSHWFPLFPSSLILLFPSPPFIWQALLHLHWDHPKPGHLYLQGNYCPGLPLVRPLPHDLPFSNPSLSLQS